MPVRKYDASHIYPLLRRVAVATLCTHSAERIDARSMSFACDPALRSFFCVTHRSTQKVQQLLANPHATMSVLATAEKLDDWSETVAWGRVNVLDRFDDDRVQQGFALLAEKSSLLQMMYESGSLGEYVMIQLVTEELCFRVYRDVLVNVPRTLLGFAS